MPAEPSQGGSWVFEETGAHRPEYEIPEGQPGDRLTVGTDAVPVNHLFPHRRIRYLHVYGGKDQPELRARVGTNPGDYR